MIIIDSDDSSFYYDISSLVSEFFPGEELLELKPEDDEKAAEADPADRLLISVRFKERVVSVSLEGWKKTGEISEFGLPKMEKQSLSGTVLTKGYDRPEVKNRLKRVLYDVLSKFTGKTLPWGTLSGIRPVKLVLSRIEKGMAEDEIKKELNETYYLSEEKTALAYQIASKEERILSRLGDYENAYSLYVGIPFCPSVCLYCSFSSYPAKVYEKKLSSYADAVLSEMKAISEALRSRRLISVYVGGGTPTALPEDLLDRVLSGIRENFPLSEDTELTVEAGRPDSITEEKLLVLKKNNVTRISINPQTMNDATLRTIGRAHTAEDVKKAFAMARAAGFSNINCDLIVGLPGEGKEELLHTIEEIQSLSPECLTVHSLAKKRAARLSEEWEAYRDISFENSEEYMRLFFDCASGMGMKPYYLYRQKNMAGNLENTGYAKEGFECLYNILIMEEKQPIIAVGAGGASKLIGDGEKPSHSFNVKYPDEYIARTFEMIERKKQALEEIGWL